MKDSLQEKLDDDEEIVWMRLPSRGKWGRVLGAIQIAGHIFLTIVSVAFAYWTPVGLALKILLGLVLLIATNAPLVAWGFYRLPKIRGKGDSIYFITNKRVGMFRSNGEIRQAPICPGLEMEEKVGLIRFSLGERTPVSFGGLRKDEMLLVSSVTEGLIKKSNSEDSKSNDKPEEGD